uniref:G-protein coupled receptors family 1 profile domain-containing protein n=1 Tax=Plectus sambesii TaxID=2011161 RepID=A0A914XLA6_9BILA
MNTSVVGNDTGAPTSSLGGMFWASMFILAEATIALIVNLYLLFATRWLRKPVTVTLLLCVSLTASDALCALCYMSSMIIDVLLPQAYDRQTFVSNCWSLLLEACKLAAFLASVLHLLALALNHYIGIVHPLRRQIVTRGSVRAAIVVAYALPLVAFLLVFSAVPDLGFRAPRAWAFFRIDGCESNAMNQMLAYRLFVVAPFITFVVIVTYLYAGILIHLRQTRQETLIIRSVSTRSESNNRRSDRKLLFTLILLAGSAVVGWLPTMVNFIIICRKCVLPLSGTVAIIIGFATQALNILKLIIDAFIYASRLVEIRYALWAMHSDFRKCITGYQLATDGVPREFHRYLNETKDTRMSPFERSIANASRKSVSISAHDSQKNRSHSKLDQSPSTAL